MGAFCSTFSDALGQQNGDLMLVFITDDDGNYITDDDGNYIITG